MAEFVVVGGGVGGLVVARRLAMAGREVVLLESGETLGGTVARHTVGGIDLDAGAESFATRGGTVVALATELGLAGAIVSPNPAGAWLHSASGRAFPLPENSLLGIPGSPLARDVVDAIGRRASVRAFADTLIPSRVARNPVSLADLVQRRMGAAVLDQLVRPVVRGVHSAEAEDLDVARVAPGLLAAMRRSGSLARAVRETRGTTARAGSAVAGIDGGLHRLVDALAAELVRLGVDVRTSTAASELAPDHVVVRDGRRAGSADSRLDGTVIAAAPGLFGEGRGRRVTLATLVVEDPRLDSAPRGTGVLVADGAPGVRAKALTHATAKWEWLANRANGRHVIRLSYDDDPGSELADVARRDAGSLLGVELPVSRVADFAGVAWYRPERQIHTPHGMLRVGESISGTGLASVVAGSEALAAAVIEASSE